MSDEVSLKLYVDQRFDDSDKAIQAALVSQEKAIIKAETAAERRFELLNELRQGVATREQLEALEKIVSMLSSRLDKTDGKSAGLSLGWALLSGAIVVAGVIIGIVINLK